MRTTPFLAVLAAAALLALASCNESRPSAGTSDFQVLRDYGFDATIADPQAQWNPESYQLIARSPGGFVLLDEGTGRQNYFKSVAKHETGHPVWINHRQFAFGPLLHVITTADGRVVPTTEGLAVVTLTDTVAARDEPAPPKVLTNQGYRPRVWGDHLVAQSEDKIIEVDQFGAISEFGPGFFAEPQRHGEGICWQERPVTESDHWTGSDARRGRLYIRWRKGVTTVLANALEARWTADGGVVATVLRSEPPPGQAWWRGGTDIYYVAGPKAAPVLVAADARSPAPHPSEAVCAATGRNGTLVLCSYDGRFRRQLAELGDHAEWSHDGARLVCEEPIEGRHDAVHLHVRVFKVHLPPAAAAKAK
jgi:hypothetical protein